MDGALWISKGPDPDLIGKGVRPGELSGDGHTSAKNSRGGTRRGCGAPAGAFWPVSEASQPVPEVAGIPVKRAAAARLSYCVGGALQLGNIDFAHREHRLHRLAGALRVRIVD